MGISQKTKLIVASVATLALLATLLLIAFRKDLIELDKKENNVRLIVINYGVDSLITPFRNLFNDCFAYYIREETLKKIIVHAPDKSIGHRTQKVQIIFNFISEFTSQNEFISEKRNSARLHLSLRKILPY